MGHDVVVVGSGPNGLAAAVVCARSGLDVLVLEAESTAGGGARTRCVGLVPELRHDICSAVHPLALASPFLRAFDLAKRGVDLRIPEASYAHPLDGGRAGIAYRDLGRTMTGLEQDGPGWARLMRPLVADWPAMTALALGDRRSLPPEIFTSTGARAALAFGVGILTHGTGLAHRAFRGDAAPAMLAGVAAHAVTPVPSLAGAGTAVLLGALAHAVGWPVPVGGSQTITDALVADLGIHGGTIRLSTPVTTWRALPRARAYLFDTTPRILLDIWGDRIRPSVRRGLERFPQGGGVAKVDFVLSDRVPWRHPEVHLAGTVHLGGTLAQVSEAEREVATGRHAERPVVLVSDPATLDPSREVAGLRPLWTYAHVPIGSPRDITEDVAGQLERFAPGFRDVVVASRCVPAAHIGEDNRNYRQGGITAGAVTMWRMLARPRAALNPYNGGIPGVYLCSASTPPGPAVHGMGGWFAAQRALRERFGITTMPALRPGS